ncbi:MAG: tetratricopeptide repeat protein [Gemmatimonadaceae bacterium]
MTTTFRRFGRMSRSSAGILGIAIEAAFFLVPAPHRLQGQTLGTIRFPTSGNSEAQPHFIRGVLFLHSFEYDAAARAFREAQKSDPDFAMAYWGEAMTYNHPVWNEQDLKAAREALGRLGPAPMARSAKAPTPRERAYLQAVEVLYGDGPKPKRDTLYSEAMAELARQYPDDHDAQTFYALSLIGLGQGTRHIPTYERAGVIASEVLKQNRDHPGAAHYIIHAYDDPLHAALGLEAARAYSKIAPDAAHAQHMTTHIFVALGMWDDVVSQNEIASGHDHSAWRPGHYTSWLGYGYLQQGRYSDARKQLETVRSNVGAAAARPARASLISMRAHYIVNTQRWDDPVLKWEVDTTGIHGMQLVDAFVRGMAALSKGDRSAAEGHLARIAGASRKASPEDDDYPVILEKQLRALVRLAEGSRDEAVALLREATKLEDAMPLEFGPPAIAKPTHELLGETLMKLGRPAEAAREFERALELTPKRAIALLGLARAAVATGDRATAARTYSELLGIWHRADADLPALSEAVRMSASSR